MTLRSTVFASVTFLALLAGFAGNAWQATSDWLHVRNQYDTEALVIGRMARSAQRFRFSEGGLLGFAEKGAPQVTSDTVALWTARDFGYQTEAYAHGAPIRSFSPYFSHAGLQGAGFAALDAVLPLPPSQRKLDLFRGINAALVAAGYTLVVFWLRRELGLGAALACLACLLVSPWLAAFSPNLYWSLWLFLLPPIAIGATLAAQGARPRNRWLAGAAFVAFFVRFLAGYEFITAAAAMTLAPVAYRAVRDRWSARETFRAFAVIVGAAAAALVLSLGVLLLQISAATGSKRAALRQVEFAIARRTGGAAERLPSAYAPGLRAKTSDVVGSYLSDRADRGAGSRRPAALRWLNAWTYGEAIALIFLAMLGIVVRARIRPAPNLLRARALAAAVVTCLAGILAWLVLFKAHSYYHLHVNPLMWHLLFLPLGASLVFTAAADTAGLVGRAISRQPLPARPGGPASKPNSPGLR